jgi:opacity protein-like surface antigen
MQAPFPGETDMLRTLIIAAALLLATPAAASDAHDAVATIRAFIAGIDKGDMAAAAATHVTAPDITDEFPPYHWSGAGAFAGWGADYGKDAAANGVTDGILTIRKVQRIRVEADHAYAVVPTDYSFKRKGKKVVEHAVMTYALTRTPNGWRIASWAFGW